MSYHSCNLYITITQLVSKYRSTYCLYFVMSSTDAPDHNALTRGVLHVSTVLEIIGV